MMTTFSTSQEAPSVGHKLRLVAHPRWKEPPGTLPRLPNLNQQRFRENDIAWTSAAFTPPPPPLPGLPTSSFVSLLPSGNLLFQWHKKRCPEIYCWKMEYWIWFIATGVWNIPKKTQLLFWLTGGTCFVTRICATVYPSLPTTSCLSHYLSWHREEEQQPLHLCFQV